MAFLDKNAIFRPVCSPWVTWCSGVTVTLPVSSARAPPQALGLVLPSDGQPTPTSNQAIPTTLHFLPLDLLLLTIHLLLPTGLRIRPLKTFQKLGQQVIHTSAQIFPRSFLWAFLLIVYFVLTVLVLILFTFRYTFTKTIIQTYPQSSEKYESDLFMTRHRSLAVQLCILLESSPECFKL